MCFVISQKITKVIPNNRIGPYMIEKFRKMAPIEDKTTVKVIVQEKVTGIVHV